MWVSCKYTYIPSLSLPVPSLPARSSQSADLSSLLYTCFPLAVGLHMVECIYVSATLSVRLTFSFLRCVHQPVIQSKSERGKQILYVQARKTVLMKLFAGKEKRCCCWEWQYPFLRSRFLLWDGLKHYEWVQALSVFFLLLLQRNRIINPFF